MAEEYRCWKCGALLPSLLMPLSRREECAGCGADLHVCRFCRHYDAKVAGGCREERAEEVFDKHKANFCDYLQPNPEAYQPSGAGGDETARAQLAELFGEAAPEVKQEDKRSDADRAMDELKRLFGDDPKDG